MTASENTQDKLEKEPAYECFMCERQGVKDEDWPLESLRYLYGPNDAREDHTCFKLCKKHVEFCKVRIPELEAVKPEEKPAVEPFIPPKEVKPSRNFYEREPGEDA